MATNIQFAWSNVIDPFRMPTETGGTRFVIPNSDGVTSTVINGSDFVYGPGGVPAGGTITSIELILNADSTVFQRMTDVSATMAEIGAFVGQINTLRNAIGWFNVIDQSAAQSPLFFSDTMIIYVNTDGDTYTIIQGSGFDIAGGYLSGTVTSVIQQWIVAGTLKDAVNPALLPVTLADGGSAMFNEVASIQSYLLCGAGDNTLERLNTGVTVGDTTYWVDYVDNSGSDTIAGPVPDTHASYALAPEAINANLVTQTVVTGADTDTFTTTHLMGVTGTEFDDTITGDTTDNILHGGPGSDTVNGGSGDDLVAGDGGHDSLIGGLGTDTVSYEYAPDAVTVSLALQNRTQDTVGDGVDYLSGFENLAGSPYGDMLTGNSVANMIVGFDGDDTINGGGNDDTLLGLGGNDSILGGSGNDTLVGGSGDDYLCGNADIDAVDYTLAAAKVEVNLAGRTATDGGGGTDTLIAIENVFGSGFDDVITGSSIDNFIEGGDGADSIMGLGGNDYLLGMNGNDTINGGAGDDEMTGEAGADRLIGGTGNDTIDGGADNDTEFGNDGNDVMLGGDGNDYLIAGAGDDQLDGGNDDDILKGDAGADWLMGGAGRDNLYGGADADRFIYTTAADSTVAVAGRDVIRDFEQGSDSIDLSALGSFDFIATGGFTGTGHEVRYTQYATITRVSIDIDGVNGADMSIDLIGSLALTADDFILGPIIV